MQNRRAITTVVGGTLIAAGSLAHALFGLPPLRGALVEAHVAADVIDTLSVGWYFGSVAMFALGAIAVTQGFRLLRGRSMSTLPTIIVAVAYVLFGAAAFLWSEFHPHFLGFVALGLLVGVGAIAPTNATRG